MTQSQLQVLANVGIVACWGAFTLVWLVGAVYTANRGPAERSHARFGSGTIIVAVIMWVILHVWPAHDWRSLIVQAAWVRILGLVILAGSTAFAIWARGVLGTMWSMGPMVKEEHKLRTEGPYGITRHPIYTAMLGMVLGTSLLVGVGHWAPLFPVSLVVLEVKIYLEERLMLATFPDDYPQYRRRVPQLIPGLRVPGRRRAAA